MTDEATPHEPEPDLMLNCRQALSLYNDITGQDIATPQMVVEGMKRRGYPIGRTICGNRTQLAASAVRAYAQDKLQRPRLFPNPKPKASKARRPRAASGDSIRSVPQRRAKQHDPLWTAKNTTTTPFVSRATLEANRQKMDELIRRSRCGEVKPLILSPGQTTIERKRR